MSDRQEELDAIVSMAEAERGFLAAKENAQANPDDKEAQDIYRQAKDAFRQLRQFWREVRDYKQACIMAGTIESDSAPGDATVTPEPIRATATVKEN